LLGLNIGPSSTTAYLLGLAITWWCFFGGEEGAAGLALMPSHQVVAIGEHSYLGVLVPLAPVPFGGAFIYVPANWVEPAEGVSNG
jgi:uncharacterized membrane protein